MVSYDAFMLRSHALVLFSLFSSVTLAAPAGPGLRQLQKELDAERIKNHVPGASLAVVEGDQVVLLRGFGYRNMAKREKATPDTAFGIGSASKAFTALLLAQAAQDGKVSLDDSPRKYLPEFHLKDPDADAKITITDILSHRCGLPRTDVAWYAGNFSRDDLLRLIAEGEPTAKLGQRWQYQNVMFMAAGMIDEKLYGKPYADVLRDRLFGPLGMTSTRATYAETLRLPELATGYDSDGKQALSVKNADVIAPAGAIVSTARDMSRWLRLQLGGGTLDGRRIVDEAAIAETRKPRIDVVPGADYKYGLGWFVRKWHGTTLIEHGGNIDGYNAEVAFLPEKHVGFVLLTNVSASPLAQSSIDVVFRNLVPAEAEAAPAKKYAEAADADLGAYRLEIAKTDLKFFRKNGQVYMNQNGIELPLKPIGDRRYEVGPPAPGGIFFTFQPASDAKATTVLLEQAGMKFTLNRAKPYEAPISVDDLMSKEIEAMGGRDAILRHPTFARPYTTVLPSDGVTVRGVEYERDGHQAADYGVLFGLGRPFATTLSYCDGKQAAEGSSFSDTDVASGDTLAERIRSADIASDLDWKTAYASIKITGEDKVGQEDVYVVEKTPKQGKPVTEYVSKTSFRVLRRISTPGAVRVVADYSNFHTYDGLVVADHEEAQPSEGGKRIQDYDPIQFGHRAPDSLFHLAPGRRLEE